MSALTKGLLIVVAVLALGVGVLAWQLRAAHRTTAEAAVAPAKEQAAVAKLEEQKAAATLAARIDTVTRWLTHTVHDTVPTAALHPVTPADTAAAVAELPKVEARYQGCRAQLALTVSDCAAFRVTAEKRFAADSTVIAKQDRVIDAGLPMRRWSLGITAGYGGTVNASHVYTGPSLTAGLHLRIY